MKAKMIKEKCMGQNQFFRKWDIQRKYEMFHHSHYDWWAFPINQPSSYGDKYQIGEQQFNQLRLDGQFITALRSNAILVCKSWGYNLSEGKQYSELQRKSDQRWQKWPIRLYKMTKSLELFGQDELFRHAIRYGNHLIRKGNKFVYSMRRLHEYFEKNQQMEKQQPESQQVNESTYGKSKSVYKYNNLQKDQGQLAGQPLVNTKIISTKLYDYYYPKINLYRSRY